MSEIEATARPYAQAVFELARESESVESWSMLLEAASAAVRSEDMVRLANTPGIDRQALASALIDVSLQAVEHPFGDDVRNFMRLLAENGRLLILPAISTRFETLKAEIENVMDVTLTTPSAVDDGQLAKISEALKKRFGRDVNLTVELDESLIGGARLRADDLVIDGTVRARLEKLASALVH